MSGLLWGILILGLLASFRNTRWLASTLAVIITVVGIAYFGLVAFGIAILMHVHN